MNGLINYFLYNSNKILLNRLNSIISFPQKLVPCKQLSTTSFAFSSFQKQQQKQLHINKNCVFFYQNNVNKIPYRNYALKSSLNSADAKLAKDIIVYKYENSRFFKVLNIFAICQFFFWIYLAHFSYTTLRDAPVKKTETDDKKSWYEKVNLGDNKYRNGISTFCLILGWGVLALAWTYTLRSVRYLILRKNGNEVCFVTYTPFGQNRLMNVPLKCISAQESREATRSILPLKVKNKSFYYILDMRGEFRNTRLYDYTIGLKRNL